MHRSWPFDRVAVCTMMEGTRKAGMHNLRSADDAPAHAHLPLLPP